MFDNVFDNILSNHIMQGYISYIIDEFYHNHCETGKNLVDNERTSDEELFADLYCMFYAMIKNIHIYNLHDHVLHTRNMVDFRSANIIKDYKIDTNKIKETVDRIFDVLTNPEHLRSIFDYCRDQSGESSRKVSIMEYYEKNCIIDMLTKIIRVKHFMNIGYDSRTYFKQYELTYGEKEAEDIYYKAKREFIRSENETY